MSFLIATPEIVSAAATDLAALGSMLSAANAAAATATTGVLPAPLDEVSAAIAAVFGAHGQTYQALGAQALTFQEQFVQNLTASAGSSANAEANIVQALPRAAPPLNTGTLNLGLGNIGNVNLGSGNIGNLNLGSGNRGGVVNGTTRQLQPG